jgi:hypothetical protein
MMIGVLRLLFKRRERNNAENSPRGDLRETKNDLREIP